MYRRTARERERGKMKLIEIFELVEVPLFSLKTTRMRWASIQWIVAFVLLIHYLDLYCCLFWPEREREISSTKQSTPSWQNEWTQIRQETKTGIWSLKGNTLQSDSRLRMDLILHLFGCLSHGYRQPMGWITVRNFSIILDMNNTIEKYARCKG